MERIIYLNGTLRPASEATLPVNDRAVLFGDGAYETLRTYGGKVFRYPGHLRRLRDTLRGIGIELPWPDEEIVEGTTALIEANRFPEARVRLTVTGGLHTGPIRLRREGRPNLIITAEPLTTPSADLYARGVEVSLSGYTIPFDSPLARLKTTNRLVNLMAKEESLATGAYEALFLDDGGNLLEGTASNIFLVVEGVVCTPSLEGPLLAGVTRDAVVGVARAAGVPMEECVIPAEDRERASEAWLTSTTTELLPVIAISGRPVGNGRPGPVREQLHRHYREMVSREIGVPLSPLPEK